LAGSEAEITRPIYTGLLGSIYHMHGSANVWQAELTFIHS